mgnify:CR=1 FL=1
MLHLLRRQQSDLIKHTHRQDSCIANKFVSEEVLYQNLISLLSITRVAADSPKVLFHDVGLQLKKYELPQENTYVILEEVLSLHHGISAKYIFEEWGDLLLVLQDLLVSKFMEIFHL